MNSDFHPDRSSPLLDRAVVLEQLERLFAHPAFKNSRRSQALLRYVVEHCEENSDGHLKERVLGIDVFGRDPGYDTNSDPVVRVVAGEVRKRIAQYYHEPGHEYEIRIDLPLGSYCPEFHPPLAPGLIAGEPADTPATVHDRPEPAPPDVSEHGHGLRWWAYVLPGLAMAALIGMIAWRHFDRNRFPVIRAEANSAIETFWQPLLSGTGPVQVGVGPYPGITSLPVDQSKALFPQFEHGMKQPVGWWDFMVAAHVIGFLQQNGRSFRIQDESVTNLSALSQGPTVLVGGTSNRWVLKLTQGLRFHFVCSGGHYWIEDRDANGKQYRSSPGSIPGSQTQYAIVARISDPTTGQYLVILAGIGSPATVFAGRMATVPQNMEMLARHLPDGWASKNIEALISGQAVGGEPGAPHVVAASVW